MGFGSRELGDLLVAGRVDPERVCVWYRVTQPGRYTLSVTRSDAPGSLAYETELDINAPAADHTGTCVVAPLEADMRYAARLVHRGERVASATFRTAPCQVPSRWTFAAFSCHQPFSSKGKPLPEAESMLAAARQAFVEQDVRFALMMGDQIYADYPDAQSLFNDRYFRDIAPPGRETLLACTRAEVRALYQQRHRQFWGLPGFPDLQSALPCFPMLDDHEVVDNFGTHPDHATPAWDALRGGALDAFFDYQASRVLPRPSDRLRPDAFDYGFTFGQAAFWMMDNRSLRSTEEGGDTRCFSEPQLDAFSAFLHEHRERSLLVLMTPIPLVHVEGRVAEAAGRLLGQGSDLHERWSHPQCERDRDRLLSTLLAHARRNPRQTILLLGGDVHSGAAFQIDFESGPRILQLTSSAISNHESAILSWASEFAAKTVSQIDGDPRVRGHVELLEGTESAHRNPFGDLNVGLVDVVSRGETVALRLRLLSHDGEGHPVTVYDSGERDCVSETRPVESSRPR